MRKEVGDKAGPDEEEGKEDQLEVEEQQELFVKGHLV